MANYNLTQYAYCGTPIPLVVDNDEETCRTFAARRLSLLRSQGFPVTVRKKGKEWEVGEPEGCCLVPDDSGILSIDPVPSPYGECRECGSSDDWHEQPRGGAICGCFACPDCGIVDVEGFHNAGCPCLETADPFADDEEETEEDSP
jgi:hypothetical protein